MALTLGPRSLGLEDCKSNCPVQHLGTEAAASLRLSSEGQRLNTDQRYDLAPMLGSDVAISVCICECGVSPWEVKLDTR